MEIDNRMMTESNCDEHLIEDCAETESCSKDAAKELCNDTEIRPCALMDDDLDNKEVNCFADNRTKEVANASGLHPLEENYVKDVNEIESSSKVQAKEVGNCAESQPPTDAEEASGGAELEPIVKIPKTDVREELCIENFANEAPNDANVEQKEAVNYSEMELCAENHEPEPLRDCKLELVSISNDVKEAPNDICLQPCIKNEAREASNDDIYSEVSNPDLPLKNVSSSMTISSQPLDVIGIDNAGCGEVTSACHQSSFADGGPCEEEHSKRKLESVSTTCVVLEIPKHVRPTGIRKITFKFSKQKEDYNSDRSVTANPFSDGEFHGDLYDNHISVSPGLLVRDNGFHNHDWNAVEDTEMNLGIDGIQLHDTRSPSCVSSRELMMSKKTIPDNYPTNVKKLLSTGILEGARVKYVSVSGEKEIPGIIKDCGYLCGCCICNFSKVVSAYEFELHAGTKTRHPNNHIYLENGKPIYSIIQELRTASLSTLDGVIKAVAGSSVNEEYLQAWKAKLQRGNDGACLDGAYQNEHLGMYHCNPGYHSHPTEDSPLPTSCHHSHKTPFHQESYVEVPVEQKRLIKKPRPNLASSFWEPKKAAAGGNKKRDNDLHKILFMPNGLPDGTSLAYYSKGKRILGGYKQGNGIVCSCCNTEISPSQFEAHAGWAVKRQPYRHIYTSSGLTLHDIALMLANGQNLASSGGDDMCAVCGDRGELRICNGCPRAFHAACLGLQHLPGDDWHCPYCRDKIGPGKKASGESRPIILRLNRVKAPEFEPGGCIICRSQDFSAANFDDRTVIICDQCEKEYHVGCLRESGFCDLKELPEDKWFCCDKCYKIFEVLQNMVCSGPETIPASVATVVCRRHPMLDLNEGFKNEIQWCVLSGKSRFPEHLLLLSRAAAIFRECFDPIVAQSGRDLIPVMVYGRNISGQEFSGMHCVVLIVKSVVVSAALLRIFGQEVAELPLVATNRENQGKGYFRALFSCIEGLLSSVSVKHLVLPAAEEAEPMWTNKLGFRKTSQEEMLKYTRDFQITMFKGTSLLEKGCSAIADEYNACDV